MRCKVRGVTAPWYGNADGLAARLVCYECAPLPAPQLTRPSTRPFPSPPIAYYNTTSAIAADMYEVLGQPDGLARSLCFNSSQLAGTEDIYEWDTKQEVPAQRTWVRDIFC